MIRNAIPSFVNTQTLPTIQQETIKPVQSFFQSGYQQASNGANDDNEATSGNSDTFHQKSA